MKHALLLVAFLADVNAPVRGFDAARAELLGEIEAGSRRVFTVAVSPDGRTIAVGGEERTVRLYATATRREVRTFDTGGGSVYKVGFSGDGRHLIVLGVGARNLHVFELAEGREVAVIQGATASLHGFAASPDGRTFVAHVAGVYRTYDFAGRETGRVLPQGLNGTASLGIAWSKDGKQIATLQQNSLRVWGAEGSREIRSLTGDARSFFGLAFSPDGRSLVTGSQSGLVQVWDVAEDREVRALSGHSSGVTAVEWSPDGRWIASAGRDGSVRLWRASQGAEVRRFEAHPGNAYALAFSRDGRLLVSGGADGKVKLWGGSR